jgi:hypothetical protein
LDCGNDAIGGSCTVSDYGDAFDIMGNTRGMHFNAFQKERLGWLNYGVSPPLITVESSGNYWIEPYEIQSNNPKALKILKAVDPGSGKRTWYYVEIRQAMGFDSSIAGFRNVLNGVLVRTGSESSGNTSYLLDMTPADAFTTNPALDVGQSFYDPNIGLTITPLSADSTGATVNVAFGPLPCVHANPSVALSPSATQWTQPGSSVAYTISVTNHDNTGCAASTFNLEAALPTGLTATTVPSLSIAPGATASTTLQVASSSSTADGFYTVSVEATNAADSTYSGSASLTYVVVSSLSVAVATDKASYTRNQSVSIAASVTFTGAPVANVNLTFTVTKANGTIVTLGAATDTTGKGGVTLRLRKQDPVGTYKVGVTAAVNGVVLGTASTSFSVQ